MGYQVNITLTALNADLLPAERVLNLTSGHHTIPIGRASKSLSKGLLGAKDNAWFDSPVMSRDHAEISLNSDNKVITIQDIGSMHGTYVNGRELQRKTPKTLNSGDVVVFGAEVRRGLETFPACAFQVNYEFPPAKASTSNTFTFPDSSDIEDEDYDLSDMEEGHEQPSSEDGVSVASQSLKSSRVISTIDLTRDDSPVTSTAPIDLTGETRFSSDSDDHSDEAGSDDSGSSDICEMDNIDNPETGDANDELPIDGIGEGAQETSRLSNLERYALATHDNQPVLFSDFRTRIEASENIMDDDDNQSDFDLSEAGAAGIRALLEDGLLQNHESHPFFSEDEKESSSVDAPFDDAMGLEINESPKHVTFESPPSEEAESMTSNFSICQRTILKAPIAVGDMTSQVGDLRWRGPQSSAVARQPSPSDAAMVKATVANHVDVHHLTTHDWQQCTAQYLGDMTGKHAFFAARELNKAQIHGTEQHHAKVTEEAKIQGSIHPVSESRTEEESQELKKQRSMEARNRYREEKKKLPLQNGTPSSDANQLGFQKSTKNYRPSHSTAISALDFPIPPLTSSSFLSDPSQVPVLDRVASPLPDMSSAVKYNESKTSMAALSTSAPVRSVRAGFKIDDIIEDSSIDQKAKDLKRKADEISDVIEQEIHAWGSSPPVEVLNNDTLAPARPAKRLRKLAEVVGYFALGGAAVGAGMFSLLVATAPDFV